MRSLTNYWIFDCWQKKSLFAITSKFCCFEGRPWLPCRASGTKKNCAAAAHAKQSVGCPCVQFRVARFGLFEAKKQICPFFILVGFEILDNLLSSWPFISLLKFIIVKSKIFLYLKQRL